MLAVLQVASLGNTRRDAQARRTRIAFPARHRCGLVWQRFVIWLGQRPLSSLARRASVKVASLSTLDLAGVMIKAGLSDAVRPQTPPEIATQTPRVVFITNLHGMDLLNPEP